MKLPRHIALSIEHNPQAIYYETVEREVADRDPGDDSWVSAEEKATAIETGELWECTWYPRTPVGSCTVRASTLDTLLAALARIADAEDRDPGDEDVRP